MKIVSTVPLREEQRATILGGAPDAGLIDRRCKTPDDFREAVRGGCDILLTFELADQTFEQASGLKWVQLLSAGADHLLGSKALARGIPITTASGIHAAPIAEYTLGLILSFAHRLHTSIRAQRDHRWLKAADYFPNCWELRDKTMGIVGYGSIGRELARLARPFGARILALKRDPASREDRGWMPPGLGDPEGRLPERWFGPSEREELLADSDLVVVTLPLNPHTRGFIGARELARMKPSARIFSVGRGGVIEESALIEALRARRVAGAGLDVFEKEPLPADSPLWDMEEVIVTPHMSGASHLYFDRACQLFADNLRRFLRGEPLFNLVDPVAGY